MVEKCAGSSETGLSADNGEHEDTDNQRDFLLMILNQIELKATVKLLKDPNVFIGDTGALSDTMVSELGFQN